MLFHTKNKPIPHDFDSIDVEAKTKLPLNFWLIQKAQQQDKTLLQNFGTHYAIQDSYSSHHGSKYSCNLSCMQLYYCTTW